MPVKATKVMGYCDGCEHKCELGVQEIQNLRLFVIQKHPEPWMRKYFPMIAHKRVEHFTDENGQIKLTQTRVYETESGELIDAGRRPITDDICKKIYQQKFEMAQMLAQKCPRYKTK